MRRLKILIVIMNCIWLLAACGSAKPEQPGKDTVKEDVQEYISELVDKDAVIRYFQESDVKENEDELAVTCVVSYESPEVSYKDEFILTYGLSEKEWQLTKCRINSDFSGKSEERLESEEAGEKTADREETEKQQKQTETKAAPAETAQEVENLSDFAFELEGVTYKLPVPYETMLSNGWKLDTYSSNYNEDTELNANSSIWTHLTNGVVRIEADIINMSGDTKLLKDCTVGSITVVAENNLDFKIAKGIGCTSSKEEVEAAFGIPSSSNSGDGYQSMRYDMDYQQFTKFYFSDNTVKNSIQLNNYIALQSDTTEIIDERPDYLNAYTMPSQLSADITSTEFLLDGALYQLPCPLSAFTENGWEIKSDNIGSLGAGNHASYGIKIKKGEYTLDLGLYNFSKKAAFSKNCSVYQISFSSYGDKLPGDLVKMPGGLSLASTADEVSTVCSTFEKNESNNAVSYTYDSDNNTKRIKYYFSLEPRFQYLEITIQNAVWSYQ